MNTTEKHEVTVLLPSATYIVKSICAAVDSLLVHLKNTKLNTINGLIISGRKWIIQGSTEPTISSTNQSTKAFSKKSLGPTTNLLEQVFSLPMCVNDCNNLLYSLKQSISQYSIGIHGWVDIQSLTILDQKIEVQIDPRSKKRN